MILVVPVKSVACIQWTIFEQQDTISSNCLRWIAHFWTLRILIWWPWPAAGGAECSNCWTSGGKRLVFGQHREQDKAVHVRRKKFCLFENFAHDNWTVSGYRTDISFSLLQAMNYDRFSLSVSCGFHQITAASILIAWILSYRTLICNYDSTFILNFFVRWRAMTEIPVVNNN